MHTLQSTKPISCFILPLLQKTHLVPPAHQKAHFYKHAIFLEHQIQNLWVTVNFIVHYKQKGDNKRKHYRQLTNKVKFFNNQNMKKIIEHKTIKNCFDEHHLFRVGENAHLYNNKAIINKVKHGNPLYALQTAHKSIVIIHYAWNYPISGCPALV